MVAFTVDVLYCGVRLCEGLVGVFFRLKVTSKKLMVCLLALMVIRSPL